MKGRI